MHFDEIIAIQQQRLEIFLFRGRTETRRNLGRCQFMPSIPYSPISSRKCTPFGNVLFHKLNGIFFENGRSVSDRYIPQDYRKASILGYTEAIDRECTESNLLEVVREDQCIDGLSD